MKLTIKKSQHESKGLFGGNDGMWLTLSCQVEVTSNEIKLIEKYKLAGRGILGDFNDTRKVFNINDLIKGKTYSVNGDSISRMFEIENEINKGIKNFKSLLNELDAFDGEKVIEF